jgi:segregation and condensation protein A
VADAAARIADLLPGVPDGAALERFLPPPPAPDAPDAERRRRGALASTLLAGLELAREGRVELRQDASFGTIEVHPAKPDGAE